MKAAPILHSTDEMAEIKPSCLAEPLDEILWQGRQWAVTTHGIEHRRGIYTITKKQLEDELPRYSWIRHMGEKERTCSDLADFATAYLVASAIFGYQRSEADITMLFKHYGTAAEKKSV